MNINRSRQIRNLIILFFMTVAPACSEQTTYRILSVFFDGVPNPELKHEKLKNDSLMADKKGEVKDTARSKPEMFVHPPYGKKLCSLCHDQNSMGKYTETFPALCYECHDDFSVQYSNLHGPVSFGYCTTCHDPHDSKYPKLLLRDGNDVCFYCHDQESMMKIRDHSLTGQSLCLDCHNPHGSNKPGLQQSKTDSLEIH